MNPQKYDKTVQTSKRKMLGLGAALVLSPVWSKPVINAVVLPAHAQTSLCETDMTVGGPLSGAPGNPANCQEACEAEAENLGAQLCEVRETPVGNDTDCACDIDTM